jgi:hypothetical protein
MTSTTLVPQPVVENVTLPLLFFTVTVKLAAVAPETLAEAGVT